MYTSFFWSQSLRLLLIISCCFSCSGQQAPDQSKPIDVTSDTSTANRLATSIEGGVRVIFQDSRGDYWFGGGEQGVYRYNGKQLSIYTKQDGLCSHQVIGIQEDAAGNIFFDTLEGVCKFNGQQFTDLEINTTDIAAREWKLEPNDLWFRMGWDKSGPYRYDGKYLYQLKFPPSKLADEFYSRYLNPAYNPYGIYSMYQDRSGAMWFGTVSFGICRFDGTSIGWLYEKHLTETPAGGEFGIRSILEDPDGDFWFCNTRYRYQVLSEDTSATNEGQVPYRRMEGMGGDIPGYDFPYFMSMTADQQGTLWLLTYDGGVWQTDGAQFIHHPVQVGGKQVPLFSIYADLQDVIWLASSQNGVFRFTGQEFEKFQP
ncbi:ligand-binding sensor domain-containing protein [Flavilitoribacter nigricans]|uniref:Diguanylate cyclase n=1 Tax=Flavilitoribacter nigricans (strain ATCC 23147 / DSM 23189 / NBRC 102662 / NCIMB 1420 / SS-2) TaxID=1122177 RepID=A0A2D0N5W6_FLAN2|nr:two-component regulator propeller domain-containing protein [Flavilitoribacter nigricans]PHN03776.1 hypothetical protein CRP01_24830 [Flavilitoribacter nigricans DSM 23189 = NBRC 102662]